MNDRDEKQHDREASVVASDESRREKRHRRRTSATAGGHPTVEDSSMRAG